MRQFQVLLLTQACLLRGITALEYAPSLDTLTGVLKITYADGRIEKNSPIGSDAVREILYTNRPIEKILRGEKWTQ